MHIFLSLQIYLQSVQHKQQDGDSDEDGGDQVDNLALKLPKVGFQIVKHVFY